MLCTLAKRPVVLPRTLGLPPVAGSSDAPGLPSSARPLLSSSQRTSRSFAATSAFKRAASAGGLI